VTHQRGGNNWRELQPAEQGVKFDFRRNDVLNLIICVPHTLTCVVLVGVRPRAWQNLFSLSPVCALAKG
jgi:hypothetical protein